MGRQLIKCPDFIEAGLIYLELEMGRVWGNFGLKFVSPFRNTGTNFKNDVFEVNAYDWSEKSDAPNFRIDDFEIYWYKYMGRGMYMNKDIDANTFFAYIDRCVQSIRDMEDRCDGGTRSREYATVNLLVGECRGFALEDIYHQYIVTEIPLQYISRLSMNSQKNYTRIEEMMNGIHDGVVIIPDLETHVHSSRLEELCRLIYSAAKNKGNKVFASTDSYECIRYMFEVCQNDMWLFRVESENIIEYDPETIEAAIRANLEVR